MDTLRRNFLAAFIPSLMMSTQAFSATIQFTDATGDGQRVQSYIPYNEASYTLTPLTSGVLFTSSTYHSPFINTPSGSDYVGFCVGCLNAGVQLKRTDNQPFTLYGLDFSYEYYGSEYFTIDYTLTGQKADYTTFNYTFDASSYTPAISWHTLSLAENVDFSNLRQLTITATSPNIDSGAVILVAGLDNIVISEVPIPASAGLLGSAFFGLAALMQTRSKLNRLSVRV